jgi:hypothetical protein
MTVMPCFLIGIIVGAVISYAGITYLLKTGAQKQKKNPTKELQTKFKTSGDSTDDCTKYC